LYLTKSKQVVALKVMEPLRQQKKADQANDWQQK